MSGVVAAVGALILQTGAAQAQDRSAPFIVVQADDGSGPSNDAWWVRTMTIRPTGTAVSGVPFQILNGQLSEYDAPWCFAEAQTPKAFVGETPEIQAEIDRSMTESETATFAAHGRFTLAGRQTAVVGSFQTCQGDVGAFLLITDDAPTPNLVYLHKWDDWKGLIWLHQTDDELSVGSCFECDHAEYLFFDQRRRRFYWETPDF
jgi:hypothetical protein